MAGGLGDDTYVVDVAGDVVTEAAGAGTDTIEVAACAVRIVTYSLASKTTIENLTYLGTVELHRHRQRSQQHHHRRQRQ